MIPAAVTASLIEAAKAQSPEPITIATGGTGYLDERFMPEKSVSWGADRFGRSFITLCLRWVDGSAREPGCGVSTFFQRYKDDPGFWAVANNAGDTFPAMSGALRPADVVTLIDLVLRGRARAGSCVVQLTTPADVREACAWEDSPRAADDSPSAEVHSDTAAIVVTDEKSPHGRHEP